MNPNGPMQKSYAFGIGFALLSISAIGMFAVSNDVGPAANRSTDPDPANKAAAAGSVAVVLSPAESEEILKLDLKATQKQDLLLMVSLECVITTEVTTVGNDLQHASGTVRVWIEDNGVPVAVTGAERDDVGRITFCDHFVERETSMFNDDDENETIRTLDRIGAANAFNWISFDVGTGDHHIVVKADLSTDASERADALAAVGKRTLAVVPIHGANGASI